MSRTTTAVPMLRMSACILACMAGVSFGNAASAQQAGAPQPRASVDFGALNMRYADSVKSNAIALTPAFWIESSSTSLSATGNISRFSAGGWSLQGNADGSVFSPRKSFFVGELEGSGGGSTHNDGARTGQALTMARAHFANDVRGIWIGGGLGGAYDGAAWKSVRQGEAAAWARFRGATAFASVTPVGVGSDIRYTDTQLSGSLNLPIIELDASAGFRSGSNIPSESTSKSWGSGTVTAWLASRLALVASAGTYPVDLTQGFPGGRFASIAIRFGTRRYPPATPSINDLSTAAASRSVSRFETRNVSGGLREIRIQAPNAHAVEIMGDFTSWHPISLENVGGGWWSASLGIPQGIHELNMRIDGGKWIIPPGLPAKTDEFGGSVGVLILR
jgi:hypothetical protein